MDGLNLNTDAAFDTPTAPMLEDLQIEPHAMAAALDAFVFTAYYEFLVSRYEPTYDEEIDPFRQRFAVIEQERINDIQQLDAKIAALHEETAMLESSGVASIGSHA
ncbi:hypothetical protein MBANPS3_000222 [Mucor bainieri]